jgi:hypothetical protein
MLRGVPLVVVSVVLDIREIRRIERASWADAHARQAELPPTFTRASREKTKQAAKSPQMEVTQYHTRPHNILALDEISCSVKLSF